MRYRIIKGLTLGIVWLLAFAALAPSVWAAGPVTLDLQAPAQVQLGQTVSIVAKLRDGSGAPVPAATVVLWTSGNFLGTDGSVSEGRAVTDAQGVATFKYQARDQDSVTLNASFGGDNRHAAAQASVKLAIVGSAQLYQEQAGVKLPGISVWLIVGILGGVWSTYFAVMVLLTLIANEGAQASYSEGGRDG